MSDKMSSFELDTWESLHTVVEKLKREVGRDLWANAELSDTEFTVLAHLRLNPEGVRPGACAQAIGWDSSRLSHQLRRLEKRGLVQRQADAHDGRAAVLVVTDVGQEVYRKAIGPHLRSARKWFAAALSPAQLEGLAEGLNALQAHIDTLSNTTSEEKS
ncbi:MarR family winged helix-turn-helix transcriptional regulator [Lacisediminihabitans profunda]|uniref:Winged helix-turn-helix transcriptional regulator n=1 Tax=Lacisediminihabitans profunda TaxID=2594790 RepID=A0A5C8UQ49_9MICO|nr:MarR family winged helix-turn-helix transcriptional regulator [Lacisediminihabitans profunda]TXN30596.1 winged helix-turn-helix transcriptional regulator [Lacisediminihabitans profunda]